ncbi:MAG: YCF48-related protein, partial [Ignavibacteriaceae bacterium]|nr:YCF48-related protein [Ignavibacteriaceae bacterium]
MNLKFIFILSFLIYILPINSFAQWEWKNPNPQANKILDSYFIDDMNGWAVGYYGTCIKTTDGGENWQNLQMPINTHLESVHFVNHNKGFIGDWGGNLLTTTDGGSTWSIQHIDNYANIYIFFLDQNYGWLLSSGFVTSTYKVYKTTDGGTSWQSDLLPITRSMYDIYFIDSSKGFVVSGFGDILMTTDSGVSWSYVNSPVVEGLFKITFKNPQDGFIVGSAGTVLQTSDGGINWDYRVVGQYTHSDISFFGQDKGIIVGARTFITNNGGNTWVQNYSIGENSFSTCNYLDENNCIVLGYSGNIYKSTGNLASWELKVYGDRNTISDMIFLNSMTGFTVGSEGTILQTFDGGTHWPKQAQLTNEKLTSISFSDNQHGWVVGTNSVFLKSTSGGIGWLPDSIPDCYDLFSVDFINNDVGWVAGNYSKILNTTDGGDTWSLQSLNFGHTINISSIDMIDENIGYAVGNYSSFFPPKGIIFKTTNGGIEWDSLKCFNSYFNSMFFQNLLDGWAVGETQDITIHTTDGGISWTNVTIGGGNDIFFDNNLKGI